jgi:hypothetical protein
MRAKLTVAALALLLAGCAGASPPPVKSSPPPASPAAPDVAAQACAGYTAAIGGPLGTALAGGPGAFGTSGTLAGYGGKLAHWSYLVTKAGTDVQLANDLAAAGLALTEAGVEPTALRAQALQEASTDVGAVTSDCNAVT